MNKSIEEIISQKNIIKIAKEMGYWKNPPKTTIRQISQEVTKRAIKKIGRHQWLSLMSYAERKAFLGTTRQKIQKVLNNFECRTVEEYFKNHPIDSD